MSTSPLGSSPVGGNPDLCLFDDVRQKVRHLCVLAETFFNQAISAIDKLPVDQVAWEVIAERIHEGTHAGLTALNIMQGDEEALASAMPETRVVESKPAEDVTEGPISDLHFEGGEA